MAGKIIKMINQIVDKRAGKNTVLIYSTKAKITLMGICVDDYDENSYDSPEVIDRLLKYAEECNIKIT